MNFSNILTNLAGSNSAPNMNFSSAGNVVGGFASKIPGGLAGGALAGGLVALLVGNKTARKTVGTAAKYGGAAVLGGLAYKAYKNWQGNSSQPTQHANGQQARAEHSCRHIPVIPNYENEALAHSNGQPHSEQFDLVLIKAMIASARADGVIDDREQSKITEAIESMNLDSSAKSQLLSLFMNPVSADDFVEGLKTIEQKAEVYLASCLVIELDNEKEYAYLSDLARKLSLPPGLEHQLRVQASGAMSVSA